MARTLYRGFSTFGTDVKSNFLLTDVELVKRDLLNHIYTTPGERLMDPNFGTRIPLMAFEPLDQTSISIIEADLRMVFNYDPRVKLVEVAVMAVPDNNLVVGLVDFIYVELNQAETMKLSFPVGG